MIYTITYYAGMHPTGTDSCSGSIECARTLAVDAVTGGLAQRAEVRDIKRRVLYKFSRMRCL